MNTMSNAQFLTMIATAIGLFLSLLASQIGGFYFLTSRIDRVIDKQSQFEIDLNKLSSDLRDIKFR